METIRNVTVMDNSGSTTLYNFDDSFEGLFKLITRYNCLRIIYETESDENKKVTKFKEFLGFKALCKRILDGKYFMLQLKELKDNQDVRKFIDAVNEYDLENTLFKSYSRNYIETLVYFEMLSCSYRFSEEHYLADQGDIRKFNEDMLSVTKYLIENNYNPEDDEIDDEESESNMELLRDSGLESLLVDEVFRQEDEKEYEPVEQYKKSYPLHPSSIKILNKAFALNKNFYDRRDIIIYLETFLDNVKNHDELEKYKNDFELSKCYIKGFKSYIKDSIYDNYGADENFCFERNPIPTRFNDKAEFVLYIFDTFEKNKDYSVFKLLDKKIKEYNSIGNIDDAILFIQDISDILKDKNMLEEYDCLNNIISLDASPNSESILILAEMIKKQLSITLDKPENRDVLHKKNNKNEEDKGKNR